MKITKTSLLAVIIAIASIAVLPACKAKKLAVQPTPPPPEPVTTVTTPPPTPAPVQQETPAPPPAPKPDYNFSNIQFEYNSGILKTDSYPILDKAAEAMKMDESVKFVLNGNASAEGTADHNMALSIERANAVKQYLVNTGVPATMLSVKGFGESNPIADNSTEDGRKLNRRVEIKKL